MPLFGKGSSTKNAAKHRARTQSNLGTVEHMRAHDSFFALDMVDLGLANLDVAVTDRDRAAADAQQGTGAGGVAFRRASTANTYRRHSSVDHGAYYYEKMDAPRRATLRYGYEASAPGQISLPEGAVVDVIEGDAAADFWSVRCLLDGREGLCQRDYLEEMGKETLWELPPGALVIDGVADAADAGSLGSLKVAVALGSVAGGMKLSANSTNESSRVESRTRWRRRRKPNEQHERAHNPSFDAGCALRARAMGGPRPRRGAAAAGAHGANKPYIQ